MTLDKADIVGQINLFWCPIVASIGFGIEVISNKNTFKGAVIDFRVVLVEDENEGLTANFT